MAKHNGKVAPETLDDLDRFDADFATDTDIEDGFVESDAVRWEREQRSKSVQTKPEISKKENTNVYPLPKFKNSERLSQLEASMGKPAGYYLGDEALAEQEARDLECD